MADATRHEYRKRLYARLVYAGLGITEGVLGYVLGFTNVITTTHPAPAYVLIAFLISGGMFLLLYGLRTKVIIQGDRIEATGAFTTRKADAADIVGYRWVATRQSRTRRLYRRSGGSILVQTELATDDFFERWFQRFPNLDDETSAAQS